MQSVTPHLSLGGEVFWVGQHRKSGIGHAARYETDKMVGLVTDNYLMRKFEVIFMGSKGWGARTLCAEK